MEAVTGAQALSFGELHLELAAAVSLQHQYEVFWCKLACRPSGVTKASLGHRHLDIEVAPEEAVYFR